MIRFILLAIAIWALPCGTTFAEDYLLRVDVVGYVDRPAAEARPREEILQSIEVIARPDLPFRTKVTVGARTLTLAGKLRHADVGGFTLDVRYAEIVDTGDVVPTEGGGQEPVLGKTTVDTTVTISLGSSAVWTRGLFSPANRTASRKRDASRF